MSTKLHFSDKYHRPYIMGISIILIFIYHLWLFLKIYNGVDIHPLGNFFGYGYLGVDIFFFLSSYGLSYSINCNSLGQFYKNRLSRIAPVYVVFLSLCIAVFINENWRTGLYYFFSSITGLAVFKGFPQVEWYTPSLIIIYGLFPLINLISRYIVKANIIVVSIIFIVLHFLIFKFNNIPLYSEFAHRIPIIFFGCVSYYLERKEDNIFILILSLLAIYGICFSYGCHDRVTFAIPALLFVIGKTDKLPLHKIISFLGKWSFEIYLAQVIATKYFMKIYCGNVLLEILYVIGITLILAGIFAYITHYFNILVSPKRKS